MSGQPKQFVPTGLLTLGQAIDHLIDRQLPDLRVKILSESLELYALPPQISRAPAPIRPLGQRSVGHMPERPAPSDAGAIAQMEAREQLRARIGETEAREQLRARLQGELLRDQATWATERVQAIAQLGQAFCDAVIPARLLMETTGETMLIPAARWSTKEAAAAFQSGNYTLITPVGIIKGTVVVLSPDIDRWLASKSARASPQVPPIPKQRGPKASKRGPTVERMVKDYVNRASALDNELEKTLSANYGVSRTTVREARKLALLKLRQIPT